MADTHKRPGNRPVEQQERHSDEVERSRPVTRTISGPGAADFIAAPGGLDRPESGGKGTEQLRSSAPLDDRGRLALREGTDDPGHPAVRSADEDRSGSQTGTVGGGGPDAHNPSPERATGSDREPATGGRDEA